MVLRIYCANVNKSNHITQAILNNDKNFISASENTDIIVITEPWIGTIRPATNEKGTVNHPNWKCHIPLAPIKKARVVVYTQKHAKIQFNPLTYTT